MLDLNNLPEVKTTRYRKSLLLNESPRLPHFFEYSWTQTNLKRQKLKQWRTRHQLITQVSHSWRKSLTVLGPPLECLRNHGADPIYINPWGLLSLFVYLNKCFVFSSEVFLFKYIKVLLTKRVFRKFVVKKKYQTHQCIKKSIPKINSDYAIWPVFNTVSSSVNESQKYYFEDLHKYVLLFSIQITEHGLSSLIHNCRKIIP